jgi:hypothetical protein
MNARTPATDAPVFELHFLSEEVPTVMFGTVIVRELPARQLQKLYSFMPDGDDPNDAEDSKRFAWHLLCEAAHGEQGECFTEEVLENIPNRGMADIAILVSTAVRLNGLNRTEVEKA